MRRLVLIIPLVATLGLVACSPAVAPVPTPAPPANAPDALKPPQTCGTLTVKARPDSPPPWDVSTLMTSAEATALVEHSPTDIRASSDVTEPYWDQELKLPFGTQLADLCDHTRDYDVGAPPGVPMQHVSVAHVRVVSGQYAGRDGWMALNLAR